MATKAEGRQLRAGFARLAVSRRWGGFGAGFSPVSEFDLKANAKDIPEVRRYRL